MAYTRYTTFISGFNTKDDLPNVDLSTLTPEQQFERIAALEAFSNAHFVQVKHTGICKPETVRKLAARHGIVRGLRAEAVSFDQSGKGRHSTKAIDL